ncbi:MAG: hypothetical protein RSB23_02435 [Alistipes sp.]
MKRVVLIFTLLLCFCVAEAQNIVLGTRVPELKVQTWLEGRQPAPSELTYIEFFHSASKSGFASLDHLKLISNKLSTKLSIIVIVQEQETKTLDRLRPYCSGQMYIGIDNSGKDFLNFGVSYVPFGVLVNAKDRALWMGNTLKLTPAFIEKIEK